MHGTIAIVPVIALALVLLLVLALLCALVLRRRDKGSFGG
jgi:hypothetical protein